MGDRKVNLEEKIEQGLEAIRNSVLEMRRQYRVFQQANKDTNAYQLALEALTRESDSPYKRLRHPSVSFESDNGDILSEVTVHDSATSHETIELDIDRNTLSISPNSPTGTVRKILMDVGTPMTIDQIMASLPSRDPAISRENLYRILSRMVSRGEVEHVSRSRYQYSSDFVSAT